MSCRHRHGLREDNQQLWRYRQGKIDVDPVSVEFFVKADTQEMAEARIKVINDRIDAFLRSLVEDGHYLDYISIVVCNDE